MLPGVPTLLIDHHAPFGTPPGAVLLTSYGTEPTATSGLLALWCAQAIAPEAAHELQWLAGISLLSDLGDKAPFAELEESKRRFGATALKDLTALLNAPRRSAVGDATVALELLLRAESPKQVMKGDDAALAELRAAKAETSAALAAARRTAPKFSTKWKAGAGRGPCHGAHAHTVPGASAGGADLAGTVEARRVFGVNTGFRPGHVHFSGRAPKDVNLLRFLREHTPAGADGTFGGGHDQASGGALPVALWNEFATEMGFGPEMQVRDEAPPCKLRNAKVPRRAGSRGI